MAQQAQQDVAKTLAAAMMAIATAASAALSAGVSMLAANAVTALSALGSEVGLGAATAGVGLDGLLQSLQHFALIGGRPVAGVDCEIARCRAACPATCQPEERAHRGG